jgi:hypothetical protein
VVRTGGRPKRTCTSRYLAGGLPVSRYRRELEHALNLKELCEHAAVRELLQARLAEVLAEEDSRTKIANTARG